MQSDPIQLADEEEKMGDNVWEAPMGQVWK